MSGETGRLLEGLPDRFLADKSPLTSARFRLHVGRTVRDVVVRKSKCFVEARRGVPDAEITTDPMTWQAIDEGALSGVEAFAQGRLSIRGSIEKSLLFEPLFDRPAAGGFRYEIECVSLGGTELSTLTAGDPSNPPLVLIHGLGATKASWLPAVPELARNHRLYAIDLPGHGSSSKPRGRYDAPWLADHVFRFLDVLDLKGAFVAGNSLGGRVAMEMAMTEPEKVLGTACLCPAAAFLHRPALGLVRVLRPEFGLGLLRLPRQRLQRSLRDLFYDAGAIHEDWYEAAIDDFLNHWRSVRFRRAFLTTLRNVYLDEPDGEDGFWARLTEMKPPALFVYGRHDVLITSRFSTRVQRFLPSAKVELWEDCGHVPQLEHPQRTAQTITKFFSEVSQTQKAG
jgi:pimeloyl-ACP methyl ester carboxylesterase